MKERTNSQSQLKRILVLLARILALSFLVFAFAQPFLPSKNTSVISGKKAVSIYIDNSFSMNNKSSDVTLIELAKKKAKEIVDAYSSIDEFQLLTNDFEGKHQRLVDKEQMKQLIDEVKISPEVKNISAVVERERQALNADRNAHHYIYLISDFQKSSTDFELLKNDSTEKIFALHMEGSKQNNLFIDTAWMESPVQMLNQPCKLLVKITNSGDDDIDNSRLTLNVNEQVKSISDFSVAAKSFTVDTISFSVSNAGWNRGELSLMESGSIDFDNNYFISYFVPDKLNVECINQSGANKFINALFANNPMFSYQTVSVGQVNYSDLGKQNFIVLNQLNDISSGLAQELKKFTELGGNLLILPDAKSNLSGYNSFLKSVNADVLKQWSNSEKQISSLNTSNTVFEDVFSKVPQNLSLPKSKGNFLLTQNTNTNADAILLYKDNSPMMIQYKVEKGSLFLSAVPFENEVTDLAVNPIFPPMVFRMCIAKNYKDALAYFIGKDATMEIKTDAGGEANFKMKMVVGQATNNGGAGGGDEFIPQQRIINSELILQPSAFAKKAGLFNLVSPKNEIASCFGLNYDRKESVMDFISSDDFAQWSVANRPHNGFSIELLSSADKNMTAEISELNLGTTLWKLCLVLSLLFLAVEILLLRLLK